VALLGPSGCGKSTTLFILAGLYQPTSGDIRFDADSVLNVHPRERNVGLVFQSYALYGHLTVRENIAFPLKLKRLPKREIGEQVQEVARFCGIDELLDRKPSQLSGGQQQRVAVARAIVKKPSLLLLDEPLSNLDLELRAHMRREIKRVQRETGVTTVIVTHNQGEAMALADVIFVMNNGVVEQAGDHHDLYERPANRFVAGFIGVPAMSLLDDVAVADGWVSAGGVRLFEVGEGAFQDAVQRSAGSTLGLRPEHVVLDPSSQTGVPGVVSEIVPAGRELIVTVTLGECQVTSLVQSSLRLTLGQTVGIEISDTFAHVFDGDSGAAIFHGTHRIRADDPGQSA
jgi:ABC-type sugar transport system ATPase subunit